MGSEAIWRARLTEVWRSAEKELVPVVLVCGASEARALFKILLCVLTELVLMTNLLTKNETGPFSIKIGPLRPHL